MDVQANSIVNIKTDQLRNSHLAEINNAVGMDCYRTNFPELLLNVANMDAALRAQLIGLCEKAFADNALRKHEATRVAAGKLLVTLLPEAIQLLELLLQKLRPKSMYEVHFTLFCYLDEVQHFDNLKATSEQVLELITAYLMKSKSDPVQSCWMAADLLGDHWNLEDSLSRLIEVAKNAKATTVRIAAISGLGKALARATPKEAAQIMAIMECLANNDTNPEVKREAAARSVQKVS